MADILLHTLLFPPDGNSNAYIFADIALELQSLGHKVTVIATTPHYSILEANLGQQPLLDGDRKWFKKSNFPFWNFHRRALQLAGRSDIKADVVISQSPPLSVGLINALIAWRKKAKSVYVVQDLFPDGLITQGKIKSRLLIAALRLLERSVYSNNDATIAISDGIKGHLENRVPKSRILRTIPNFVDTSIYHPMPKDNPLAVKYGVEGKFVISYVGNIGNAHDLSPILFCAKALKDLDIAFVIAGNGIRESYFREKARAEGLSNVQFLGYQKREDTPYINAFSDICLVLLAPHVKSFSFPSKIYTLMGMGKPVVIVCSPESHAADFVTQSGSGWAVPCGGHEEFTALVKHLYEHRELLEPCGRNSIQLVERGYTKAIVGRRYDDLVRELCL